MLDVSKLVIAVKQSLSGEFYDKLESDSRFWNSENDGSGSGLDADKLDGQEGSYYEYGRRLDSYTVATLPVSPSDGATAYATDGLKTGETAGTGTGVPVYYSNGQWRVYRDDAVVQA